MSARQTREVNYIGRPCEREIGVRAESIVDLGNVSLAIGSQLISDLLVLSPRLPFSSSSLPSPLWLALSPFISLLLPRCVFIRRPFPSRSFSPGSPPRLAHVRRDNSYVLRMHNVPNYFTLLLLRVINARRLARARAPVPGVFREIYCSEITRVRTRRRPTLCFSLSLCPPPSSFLFGVDGRSAVFLIFASFSYQLSQLYTERSALDRNRAFSQTCLSFSHDAFSPSE